MLASLPGSFTTKIDPGTGNLSKEETMRVMALALASILAVFVADSQAFAAKRASSSASNYNYQYQSAAGVCGGSASCYKSGSQKQPKKH